MNDMPKPQEEPYEPIRGRDSGLTGRPVRWEEFKQRCRAHRPVDLIRALAVIGAGEFRRTPRPTEEVRLEPEWAIAAVIRESLA